MEAGIHELTAAYALDALDPEERRAFEAHLEHCEQCQGELSTFWETTEALAIASAGPAPTPALRDRVLAAARAEPQVVVPLVPPARRRTVPALAGIAAVAAVALLAVGLWATQLSGDLDDAREALERERAAAAVLADPDRTTIALQSGRGQVVVAPDGRAVLVVHGLERAPAGKTYELWIIEGDTPVPAGVFEGGRSPDVVSLEGRVDPGEIVAVTVEDGEVDVPTSDPIVASEPL